MRSKAVMTVAVFLMGLSACTEENREIDMGTVQEGEACKQYSDCFCGEDDSGESICLTCDEDGTGEKTCVAVSNSTGPQRGDTCTVNSQCDPPNLY